jgi:hypothetical protein
VELRPSREATVSAATQELFSIWNLKAHYCVHKSPPLDSVISRINPVYITPSYLSKIQFNIIHPPSSLSSSWYLSSSTFLVKCPPYLILLDLTMLIIRIWQRVHVMKLLIMQPSPTSCPVISLGPNFLLSTLFSVRYVAKLIACKTAKLHIPYSMNEGLNHEV